MIVGWMYMSQRKDRPRLGGLQMPLPDRCKECANMDCPRKGVIRYCIFVKKRKDSQIPIGYIVELLKDYACREGCPDLGMNGLGACNDCVTEWQMAMKEMEA